MLSRFVRRLHQDGFEKAAEEADGRLQSLLSFAIDRASAINIPDTSKLPVLENTTRLQNDDGDFYFLFGYSNFDGPDIL